MHDMPVGRRAVRRRVLTHRRNNYAVGQFQIAQFRGAEQQARHVHLLSFGSFVAVEGDHNIEIILPTAAH